MRGRGAEDASSNALDDLCEGVLHVDVFDEVGVRFALEVHPTEIAFDIVTAERALEAIGYRESFGFNFDPSHLAYQGVDCVAFILRFESRIFYAHMKDVWWSESPMPSGVFGGHLPFGDADRFWNFRSLGRGRVPFEEIIRALNRVGYQGPLSVEWEDPGMDREHGAAEACRSFARSTFLRRTRPSTRPSARRIALAQVLDSAPHRRHGHTAPRVYFATHRIILHPRGSTMFTKHHSVYSAECQSPSVSVWEYFSRSVRRSLSGRTGSNENRSVTRPSFQTRYRSVPSLGL